MTVLWAVGLSFLLGATVFTFVMKKHMMARYRLDGAFNEAKRAIKKVIPTFDGWGFPLNEWEFHRSQLERDLVYDNITDMIMFFVCKPPHANRVLRKDPMMAGIMPCTWALYETKAGETYVAKMNIGLMCLMYFGVIGKIMRDVARTERKMLKAIQEEVYASRGKEDISKNKGESE